MSAYRQGTSVLGAIAARRQAAAPPPRQQQPVQRAPQSRSPQQNRSAPSGPSSAQLGAVAKKAKASGKRAVASGKKLLEKAQKSHNQRAIVAAQKAIASGQAAIDAASKVTTSTVLGLMQAPMTPGSKEAQRIQDIVNAMNLAWSQALNADQDADVADALFNEFMSPGGAPAPSQTGPTLNPPPVSMPGDGGGGGGGDSGGSDSGNVDWGDGGNSPASDSSMDAYNTEADAEQAQANAEMDAAAAPDGGGGGPDPGQGADWGDGVAQEDSGNVDEQGVDWGDDSAAQLLGAGTAEDYATSYARLYGEMTNALGLLDEQLGKIPLVNLNQKVTFSRQREVLVDRWNDANKTADAYAAEAAIGDMVALRDRIVASGATSAAMSFTEAAKAAQKGLADAIPIWLWVVGGVTLVGVLGSFLLPVIGAFRRSR